MILNRTPSAAHALPPFLAITTLCFLSACATAPTSHQQQTFEEATAKVTYYDRNHDGRVDYEMHDFGCCDRNWALVDTDFNGRFDLLVKWGFSLTKDAVDIRVPENAYISKSTTADPEVP